MPVDPAEVRAWMVRERRGNRAAAKHFGITEEEANAYYRRGGSSSTGTGAVEGSRARAREADDTPERREPERPPAGQPEPAAPAPAKLTEREQYLALHRAELAKAYGKIQKLDREARELDGREDAGPRLAEIDRERERYRKIVGDETKQIDRLTRRGGPVAGAEAPPLEYPLVPVPAEQHEPGSLAWYEAQLAAMDTALQAALRAPKMDAQGTAALGRRVQDLAERVREIRAQEKAGSSAGLTLADRVSRMAEAARKMPVGLLEVFVKEWCERNRIDLGALREARLVRAGEGAG